MSTVATLKKLAEKEDYMVIPRIEYEALVKFKKIREFNPTPTQKKALLKAEQNLKKGKTLSYNELVKKLGFGS